MKNVLIAIILFAMLGCEKQEIPSQMGTDTLNLKKAGKDKFYQH